MAETEAALLCALRDLRAKVAEMEKTLAERLEMIQDLTNQGADYREDGAIGHMFMGSYEAAFDYLIAAGLLEPVDTGGYWYKWKRGTDG